MAQSDQVSPKDWFHPGYSHEVMRSWQREATLAKEDLLYPVFVTDEPDAKQEITSLPEQYRWGVNRLSELLTPLVKKGLKSVLLFGVFTDETDKEKSFQFRKDINGTIALSDQSPVILAIKYIRKHFPMILIVCDVCLCAYTSHGHCGILNSQGYIDNFKSIEQISNVALHYAKAGAHCVAPSDMMDGRIKAIKSKLYQNKLNGTCAVMSYCTKYCSSFYGPFRDACHSAPKDDSSESKSNDNNNNNNSNNEAKIVNNMKDRSMYQLPPASRGLGIRAAKRCYNEGADFLMVKPGSPYMDMIRDIKNELPNIPIAVYQVSGEYAMLWHASTQNAINLKDSVLEITNSFKRAGATIIITYYAPRLLDWIDEMNNNNNNNNTKSKL